DPPGRSLLAPATGCFDGLERGVKIGQPQLATRAYHQVVEARSEHTHGITFEYRGDVQWAKQLFEGIQSAAQMMLAVGVAADAQVDGVHGARWLRSITTPTPPRAAFTAPGLVRVRCSQGT